jgi:hypothetical protein
MRLRERRPPGVSNGFGNLANYFRHQDTKTRIQVERFRVQRSGLKDIQPALIERVSKSFAS